MNSTPRHEDDNNKVFASAVQIEWDNLERSPNSVWNMFAGLPVMGLLALLVTQVMSERQFTPSERKLVSDAFLQTFQMSQVPRIRKSRSEIDIPEFMIEQYKEQTGLDVDTTNFRKPGAFTGHSNTLTTFPGKLLKHPGTLVKKGTIVEDHTVLQFDFQFDPKDNDMQAAILKVYWKPFLTIKRKSGSFQAKVSDLLKFGHDKDSHIISPLDSKKIHHRDTELDEGKTWLLH